MVINMKEIQVSLILEFLSAVSLFVCLNSLRPINNLSVKQGQVFLGLTSTKLG